MSEITIKPAEVVLIGLAASMTGHTVKQIESKIERGVLAEGLHYHRHDGRIYIDMPAFQGLVRGKPAGETHGTSRKRSGGARALHQDRFFVAGEKVSRALGPWADAIQHQVR